MDTNNTVLTDANDIIARHFKDDPANAVRAQIVVTEVLVKLPGMPAKEWLKEHERLARAFGGAEYDHGYADGDGEQELNAAGNRTDGARDALLAHARARIQAAASEAETWPMLDDLHLRTLIQLYNDGYSKAYDGREFANPCASTASQAAAWELGKEDGALAHKQGADSTVAGMNAASEAGAVPPYNPHMSEAAFARLTENGRKAWAGVVIPGDEPAPVEAGAVPYAYEYGRSNGDGTYSVVMDRGQMVQLAPGKYGYAPPADAVKEHPVKPLFLAAHPNAPAAERPTDDELWDKTLKDRDDYHDMADKLSQAIAEHFGVDIGEHSSANCPWQNALDAFPDTPAAESAEPANEDQRAAVEFYRLNPSAAVFDLHRRLTDPAKPTAATADVEESAERKLLRRALDWMMTSKDRPNVLASLTHEALHGEPAYFATTADAQLSGNSGELDAQGDERARYLSDVAELCAYAEGSKSAKIVNTVRRVRAALSRQPSAAASVDLRRPEFEAWVVRRTVVKKYGAKLITRTDGSYADYRINDRWLAWCAALAAAKPEGGAV